MTCGVLMLLVGLAFCLFGSVVVLIAVANMAKNLKSRSWPSVQGSILTSRVEEHKWAQKGDTYNPPSFNVITTYEYYIGAKRFHSDQATIQNGRGYGNREEAEIESGKSPAGTQIQVYYDPANPKESTLTHAFSFKPILGLLFGLTFVVLGVSALVSCVEQFRR